MHQCVIVLLGENLNLRLTNKMYVFFFLLKLKKKENCVYMYFKKLLTKDCFCKLKSHKQTRENLVALPILCLKLISSFIEIFN